ncbi:MAG: WecB/TagA/CpsF family glycosyltransferase [Ruminococcaceae bacterium]|nr:WecB/TagA/CpsF family glycosyltransferase [Oscillospiraceae bacterium]
MAQRVDILGVQFDNVTRTEAVERALTLAAGEKPCMMVTPNPEILWEGIHNPDLYQVLTRADLVLPDGIGILIASRILGTPIAQKVAGVEVGEEILRLSGSRGLKVTFFGGKPGVAEEAARRMTQRYPDLEIAGCFNGYFKDADEVLPQIRAAGGDILFVCLGAPKQELFIRDHMHETGAKLHLGLGGSLDVYAGNAIRAPRWMIKIGLEWFYRLLKQPKRLGRMMNIPRFLLYTLKIRLFGNKKGN